MNEPIDGFTVRATKDTVILVLSSRYGSGDQYLFSRPDAKRIGWALIYWATEEPPEEIPDDLTEIENS